MKQAVSFLKESYSRWSDHKAPRLGASVAFYSILSFAPLLLLVTAIIGFAFGHESAHGALVNEARQLMGDHGADTVESLLKNADKPASGTFASMVAFITLLFGASGVFVELQDALNIMWDAPKQQSSGLMAMIKQRLFSFGMILSIGFLLLVSLLISSALAYVGHSFGQILPLPSFVFEALNFALSFIVVASLFALMFKYLPDVPVSWREVIVGAVGTALLFTIGKFLLGIYLGAAGSLVAVVVWIYYSAQIFFFGAEFTRVYADTHRSEPATQPPVEPVPAVEHKSEPAQAPDPVAAPKTTSAAAGVSTGLPGPVAAPVKVVSKPISAIASPAAPQKVAKPRLLAAAAIGFLLGRLTFARTSNRSQG